MVRKKRRVNCSNLASSSIHRAPPFPGMAINLSSPSTAMATTFAQRSQCLWAYCLAATMPSLDFNASSSMANSIHSDERRSRVARVGSLIVNFLVTSLGVCFLKNPQRFTVSNSTSLTSKDTPFPIKVFNSCRSCSYFSCSWLILL